MHKNKECGIVMMDEINGKIEKYKDNNNGFSPYLGNADNEKIKKWWEMRAIPASRNGIQAMLMNAGVINTETYLAKNLALSMSDTYWIKPEGMTLSYEDIALTNFSGYNDGKVPYHNATSYDPNASLGGQMEKYWDLSGKTPVLVKESYKFYGQQAINEAFASYVHELQKNDIGFVKYTLAEKDNGVLCRCDAFTSDKLELVPAYEIVESVRHDNSLSLYDEYIKTCVSNGIDAEVMQNHMDYQTMISFIISDTDKHLLNQGILRDADTMKFIAPAPIFDTGNSMFYNDERTKPYSRVEILERKITSFYDRDEKMLAKVKNRSLVDMDKLPSPGAVKDFYVNAGIPEEKAEFISRNYDTKLCLFGEFQKGKTISLYNEKKIAKDDNLNKYLGEINSFGNNYGSVPETSKSKWVDPNDSDNDNEIGSSDNETFKL
jgi:hypothetical protein